MANMTVETPHGKLDLHVCKDGDTTNDDWIGIYNESFPDDWKEDISEIKMCIDSGSMELDETRDQAGRILCMTITEVFRPHHKNVPFLLACYTAVSAGYRGMGIGTVHRNALTELLKDEYKNYFGNFTEIVSTKAKGFDDAEMETRHKRKRFFLKLGLQPISIDYRFPSTTNSEESLEGELLWLPFGDQKELPDDVLADVLQRIYTEGYGLRADDPFVASMLGQVGRPAGSAR